MKYAIYKGKYQEEYDELTDDLVPRTGNADSFFGELIRIINNLYADVVEQPHNILITIGEYEFLTTQRSIFEEIQKENAYEYMLFKLNEFIQHRSKGDYIPFDENFTFILDVIADGIVEYNKL